MAGLLLLALASILICDDASLAHLVRQSTYWQLRQQLMRDEMQQSLGVELHLNSIEVKANRGLMAAKNRELHDGSMFSLFIIKCSYMSAPCARGINLASRRFISRRESHNGKISGHIYV